MQACVGCQKHENLVLDQEILTHNVWCTVAIGKNTEKCFGCQKHAICWAVRLARITI
jgi:hypothetical protein